MTELNSADVETLWDDFHRAVNMSATELERWLATQSAGEEAEDPPGKEGTEQGRQVLAVLRKRRTDLTNADISIMRAVVETVNAERAEDGGGDPQNAAWRRRLMRLGHDPLKPMS